MAETINEIGTGKYNEVYDFNQETKKFSVSTKRNPAESNRATDNNNAYIMNNKYYLGGRDDSDLENVLKTKTGNLNKIYKFTPGEFKDDGKPIETIDAKTGITFEGTKNPYINQTDDKINILKYRDVYDNTENKNNNGDLIGEKSRTGTLMGDTTLSTNFHYNAGAKNNQPKYEQYGSSNTVRINSIENISNTIDTMDLNQIRKN